MRVLIASDSFKGALASTDVCAAIARGLQQRIGLSITEFPLADGGEGTLDVLTRHLHLQHITVDACDALQRPMRSPVGITSDDSLAVIESASVCGLGSLRIEERDPCNATTRGIGLLIDAALKRGARRIVLGIGGTATNDGGVGMARALGWEFLDSHSLPLPEGGSALVDLASIQPPAHKRSVQIDVLCDVINPLYGPNGAAATYARQKGADDAGIALLDAGLRRLAEVASAQQLTTVSPHTAGSGAAGGLGFGAMTFLGARLQRGIETLLDLSRFDDAVANTDLVLTGEGRLDEQTLQGKLIQGVAARARRAAKPVIVLCGQLSLTSNQLQSLGIAAAYSIDESISPLALKIKETATNLTRTALSIPIEDFRL